MRSQPLELIRGLLHQVLHQFLLLLLALVLVEVIIQGEVLEVWVIKITTPSPRATPTQ
jgi:hypothetical protein